MRCGSPGPPTRGTVKCFRVSRVSCLRRRVSLCDSPLGTGGRLLRPETPSVLKTPPPSRGPYLRDLTSVSPGPPAKVPGTTVSRTEETLRRKPGKESTYCVPVGTSPTLDTESPSTESCQANKLVLPSDVDRVQRGHG